MVVPVVLHGDAAFSGQGVVAETFNLANLKGYKTGGTLHIIINNQIGFTTSSRDARSTFFSTDVAKMLPVPVFHVNGDDAEAVVYAVDLALRFRQTFGRDVVVDIFCYRKYGHNEGDDPSFTHPLMYRIIEKKKSPPTLYAERCRDEGVTTENEQEQIRKDFRAELKSALQAARSPAGKDAAAAGEGRGGPGQGPPMRPADEKIPGADGGGAAGDRPQDHRPAARVPHPPEAEEDHRREVGAAASGRHRGLGVRRVPGVRHAPHWTGFPSGSAGRTAPAAHSPRGTWSGGTPRPGSPCPTRPSPTCRPTEIQFSVYDSPLSEYSILGFEYGFTLGQAAGPGDVGGAVRRLLQRRAGDHRQLRGRRRGQVGHRQRHRAPPAARLRRPGARALQRAPGAVPAPVRPGQHPGVQLHDPGPVLPPPAPAGHADAAQAAHRHDSQEPAAAPPRRFPDCRPGARRLPGGPGRSHAPGERRRRLVLCSGKIYYELAARREEQKDTATAVVRVEQFYPFPASRAGRDP